MKIISALTTFLMLAAAAGVAAQDMLSPPVGVGEQPPSLRVLDDGVEVGEGETIWDEGETLEAIPVPDAEISGGTILDGSIIGEPMKLFCPPAYFESSGTWLERGYWYTEIDYVFLNRGWDRKGLPLATEAAGGSVPEQSGPFGSSLNAPVVGINELRIKGERPGAEGNGRVKLGRFLFRDSSNRDHMMEFGWYGGGKWSQSASLDAATVAGLDVTDYIDRVNRSFDGARSLSFDYDSEMNSAEVNYLLKTRMQRDQMVLEPSGQWIRKANPSKTYTVLGGIRYMNLREELAFDATDVTVRTTPTPALQENGFYDIRTSNDLLGTQLGLGVTHDTGRWSLGVMGKIGSYWNRIDLNSDFQIGETVITNSGTTNSEEDDLSFIGEFQVLGKWHLRPNLSLRAGVEVLFVDSIALAPHQLNFIGGGFKPIATSGDSVFMGTSLGVESYW